MADNVEVKLKLVDIDDPSAIKAGDQFTVEVSFTDLLNNQAVIQGYTDITFDPDVLQVDSIDYASSYDETLVKGEIDNSNGLVDEVGAAVDGLEPPPDNGGNQPPPPGSPPPEDEAGTTPVDPPPQPPDDGGNQQPPEPPDLPNNNTVFSLTFTALKDLDKTDTTIAADKPDDTDSAIIILDENNQQDQRDQTLFDSLILGSSSEPEVNEINGTKKDEELFGESGPNKIDGKGGDDFLLGESDKDTLIGGKGNDILAGDRGKDVLTGGQGLDFFVFFDLKEKGDVIKDFDSSDSDKIVLFTDGFENQLQAIEDNLLDPSQFVVGSKAKKSSHRLIYNEKKGKLYFDADGNDSGKKILLASLSKKPELTSEDILISAMESSQSDLA